MKRLSDLEPYEDWESSPGDFHSGSVAALSAEDYWDENSEREYEERLAKKIPLGFVPPPPLPASSRKRRKR